MLKRRLIYISTYNKLGKVIIHVSDSDGELSLRAQWRVAVIPDLDKYLPTAKEKITKQSFVLRYTL